MDISTSIGANVEFKQIAEDGVMWKSQTAVRTPSPPLGVLLILGHARLAGTEVVVCRLHLTSLILRDTHTEDVSQKELTLTAVETLHREEHSNPEVLQIVRESAAEMEIAKPGP